MGSAEDKAWAAAPAPPLLGGRGWPPGDLFLPRLVLKASRLGLKFGKPEGSRNEKTLPHPLLLLVRPRGQHFLWLSCLLHGKPVPRSKPKLLFSSLCKTLGNQRPGEVGNGLNPRDLLGLKATGRPWGRVCGLALSVTMGTRRGLGAGADEPIPKGHAWMPPRPLLVRCSLSFLSTRHIEPEGGLCKC